MSNLLVIRNLIREMLNEKDKFSKVKGRDYDVLKDRGLDLEKMAGEEISPGVPRYYFNMSNDFIFTSKGEKSGSRLKGGTKTTPMAAANPKAEYNTTPMGYYGYPLTVEFVQEFKEQKLPYMQGSDWLTIVEAKSTNGLLILNDTTARLLYIDRRKYAEQHLINNGQRNKLANAFATALLDPNKMIKSIKNKRELSEDEEENPFTWVYDPGTSTIHRSEPTQVVFLTPSAFKVVDRFPAKDVFESLTGGETRYRTDKDQGKVDHNIIMTLKHTQDPAVVAKLAKHPNKEVRKLAVIHPLGPKELFLNEIDKTFEKLKTLISPENLQSGKFESVATDLGMMLRGNPGGDRAIIYDKLLELLDEIPSNDRSSSAVLYGVDAILEGLAKSKDKSLSMRIMEDLAADRVLIPDGFESKIIIDTAISRFAKENTEDEKFIARYLELVTGKYNAGYTFNVLHDIMDYAYGDIEALKAVKAIAASKNIPQSGKMMTRIYEIVRGVGKKQLKKGTEEYNVFLDTLSVVIKSGNVNQQTHNLAKSIISQLEADAKNA